MTVWNKIRHWLFGDLNGYQKRDLIVSILSLIFTVIGTSFAIFFAYKQTIINDLQFEILTSPSITLSIEGDPQTNLWYFKVENIGKSDITIYNFDVGNFAGTKINELYISQGSSGRLNFYDQNEINRFNTVMIKNSTSTDVNIFPSKIYFKDSKNNKYSFNFDLMTKWFNGKLGYNISSHGYSKL